jgi:hypothetical protein
VNYGEKGKGARRSSLIFRVTRFHPISVDLSLLHSLPPSPPSPFQPLIVNRHTGMTAFASHYNSRSVIATGVSALDGRTARSKFSIQLRTEIQTLNMHFIHSRVTKIWSENLSKSLRKQTTVFGPFQFYFHKRVLNRLNSDKKKLNFLQQ